MKYEKDLYLVQQIFANIFTISNMLQVKGDQSITPLTTRQMMAMVAILHLPNENATYSNIAKMLGTTRQNVKQLISNLERKGYLVSSSSIKDKRASIVEITESGTEAVLKSTEQSISLLTDIFAMFTTKELEELWGLLKKLYNYDGNTKLNFEENVEYGAEKELTESQLRTIEKFIISRSNIENGVETNERN